MTTISTFLAISLNRLKKGVFTLLILLSSLTLFSQGGQKFSDAGNILSTSSFIGSTNAMPFVIKTNNTQKAVFTSTGWFGLGITAPTCIFDVFGDGKIHNFNVLFNQTIGNTLNVPKIISPTGTVDFDGNKITTTNEIIAGKVTTSKIWSAGGLIDFDGCNLKTTAGITGASLLISGNSTLGNLTANSFQNPLFTGVSNGLILSDANGNFQKLDFNGNQNSYLRGDGTFGSLSGTSTWDTIYANAIIGGYVNATKSIQLDGSITAGSRGTGTIGEYSIVVGGPEPMYGYTTSPVASGKYSVSFGTANESSNLGSMSFGGGNVSSGLFSFAIGGNNISSGSLSVAIGSGNTASGSNSTVIGKGNITDGKQSAIIGGTGNNLTVNAINSAIIGGEGISATQPNTVYVPNFVSNGNVGIGIETPIEKLDVNGNANIRGYLYVQDGVIIGKRIDGQRVTSDTIIADKIDVARKLKAMELEAKTLQIEKVTADTLKTDNMTLLLMQADSITAQKMTLDKLAINNIKADIEITSKDINIGEKGKFGNNIIIDGPNSRISATNSSLFFQGTDVYNDRGFHANWFRTQNGSVVIDGASGNITANGIINVNTITANNLNLTNTVFDSLRINNKLKIGTGTLVLDATTGTGGSENNIYSDNGSLFLQSRIGYNYNTIINANNTGNVGIGTSSPQTNLHIKGITDGSGIPSPLSAIIRLEDNLINSQNDRDVWWDIIASASFGKMVIRNNGTGSAINVLTITEDGKTGIGIDAPSEKLEVDGYVKATGFKFSGGGVLDGPYNAGTGINIIGNTITNTLPDQTITLSGADATTISGTYPNFTISSPASAWSMNVANELSYTATDISINNQDLLLRNSHHGLGWYGVDTWIPLDKKFNGVNVDGPVLYGWNGGALGSKYSTLTTPPDTYTENENIALRWTQDGKVGIGTTIPTLAKLHVKDDLSPQVFAIEGGTSGTYMSWYHQNRLAWAGFYTNDNFEIKNETANGHILLTTTGTGKVGIGTNTPSEKIHVKDGSIYIDGEGQGLIVNENGGKRVGFMKYHGKEAGIWRVANQDFEIGRLDDNTITGNHSNYYTDIYVKGDGNVGIGTVSPAATLSIKDGGNFRLGPWQFDEVSTATDYYLTLKRGSGGSFDNALSLKVVSSNVVDMTITGKLYTKEVNIVANATWPDYVFMTDYKLKSISEVEKYIKQHNHLPDMPSANDVKDNGINVGEMSTILLKKVEELTLYIIDLQKCVEVQKAKISQLENKK